MVLWHMTDSGVLTGEKMNQRKEIHERMSAHTLGKVHSFCLVAVNLKELKNTLERVCLLSEPTLRPGRPKYRERPIPDDTG